jgi:hypothetical protein
MAIPYDTGIIQDVTFVVGVPHKLITVNSSLLIKYFPIFKSILFDSQGRRLHKRTHMLFENWDYEALLNIINHIYYGDFQNMSPNGKKLACTLSFENDISAPSLS